MAGLGDVEAPPSVEALFTRFIAHLRKLGRGYSYTAERILLKRTDNAADALGRLRSASSVTPAEVVAYLSELYEGDRPAMAASARACLHAAFNYGIRAQFDYTQGIWAETWRLDWNPVSAIPVDPSANRPRRRFLTPAEFVDFWRWLEGKQSRTRIASAVRLIMVTGQRISPIIGLTRRHFDEKEAMLVWDRSKTGMPHSVPLPSQAFRLLNDLEPNANGLYFPKRGAPTQSALSTSAQKLCDGYVEAAGVSAFHARDLRRTWKTLAGQAGLSKFDRDLLQGHRAYDVSSRNYDRYDYLAERRAAMGVWSDYVANLLEAMP